MTQCRWCQQQQLSLNKILNICHFVIDRIVDFCGTLIKLKRFSTISHKILLNTDKFQRFRNAFGENSLGSYNWSHKVYFSPSTIQKKVISVLSYMYYSYSETRNSPLLSNSVNSGVIHATLHHRGCTLFPSMNTSLCEWETLSQKRACRCIRAKTYTLQIYTNTNDNIHPKHF